MEGIIAVANRGLNTSDNAAFLAGINDDNKVKYDDYYSIVTSEKNLSDREIRDIYKVLWKIEESFKIIKRAVSVQIQPRFAKSSRMFKSPEYTLNALWTTRSIAGRGYEYILSGFPVFKLLARMRRQELYPCSLILTFSKMRLITKATLTPIDSAQLYIR
jgi:hypothetical protein